MRAVAKYMLTALMLCYFFPIEMSGQGELSARDRQYLNRLKQELDLSQGQTQSLDSLYLTSHRSLMAINAEIKELERSDVSEKEITMRVSMKSQEKRDIKQERDEEVKRLLTPAQQTIYAERIKPDKPQVLHFGIHDRASCKVCIR